MRRVGLLLLLLAIVVTLGACGGEEEAEPEEAAPGEEAAPSFELRMGAVLPLTGDLAAFGPSLAEAARIAADEIQAALDRKGLDGVQLVWVGTEDGQTQPRAGVEAATKLVESDRVDVLIGEMASSVTIPIAESVTVPKEVVHITPTSTSPGITDLADDGFVYRILSSDTLQGRALGDAVADAFGEGATVNVGARNDAFGTALKQLFEERFTQLGGKIGVSIEWNPEAPTFDSEAQELAGGEPDGWVIIDFPETFAKFGPALVRAGGWESSRTFMTEAMRNADELKKLGEKVNAELRGTAPTSEDAPARDAFDALFRGQAKPGTELTGFEGSAFDAVMLGFLAALDAGSSEPAQIKERLRAVSGPPGNKYTFEQLDQAIQDLLDGKDIDYEGAWGPIDFDQNGDPGSAIYEVWQFQAGEVETLETFEFEE